MKVKIKKEVLKDYLLKHNISQEQFSLECGLHEGTISLILTPRVTVGAKVRQAIMNKTGLSWEHLFEEL